MARVYNFSAGPSALPEPVLRLRDLRRQGTPHRLERALGSPCLFTVPFRSFLFQMPPRLFS